MEEIKPPVKAVFYLNEEAPVEAVALLYMAIFHEIRPLGLQIEYNGRYFTITVESMNHESEEDLYDEVEELGMCYDWWGVADNDVPPQWREDWEEWVKTLTKVKEVAKKWNKED